MSDCIQHKQVTEWKARASPSEWAERNMRRPAILTTSKCITFGKGEDYEQQRKEVHRDNRGSQSDL